jgi:uncharacterized membrane protein YeaQ/YmgE (transglycosylase-associated protein family)
MSILSWIIVGLIAGWLAGQVMRGGGYGVVGDIIIGIIGGLIGGFLANAVLGLDTMNGINLVSVIVAFIGAVILVWLLRMVARPSRI